MTLEAQKRQSEPQVLQQLEETLWTELTQD